MQVTSKFNASFLASEINEIFNCNIGANDSFSISTDSRLINKEQIFLPLVGEKFDGHDFINGVINKGIKFSFCENNKTKKVSTENLRRIIKVENTLEAYQKLALLHRKKLGAKVIAITGSSGKTTTKELIATVFSEKYKVHKTEANFNNDIGVPKTILETPLNTEVLVLELAMRAKGEIRRLSKIAEPDIAVITNVGSAHIGILGDLNTIVEAKCEIFEGLKKDGTGLVNKNKHLIEYLNKAKIIDINRLIVLDISDATDVVFKCGRSDFILDRDRYCINVHGKIHVLNSIFAIRLAKKLGMNKEEIQEGLAKFKVPEGRGNTIKISEGLFVVDESYNANPESVRAAVMNLSECWSNDFKKILVLGKLAELGKHEDLLLKELGEWLKKLQLSSVITVGDKLKQITSATNVKDIKECCAILEGLTREKAVVLVKGSHVAGLDKVIEFFKKQRENN